MCIFHLDNKKHAERRAALFLKMGKWLWHFSQPRFQAVGLARCRVNCKLNEWKLSKVTEKLRTLVRKGTCPWWRHTCVSWFKGGRRETTGWEKKNKASKEAETSDNIQRAWTYLAYVTWQCMSLVTCSAVSLDQLEPKKAHGELLKDWQLFLFEYKNSIWPQANNSLSCSWNNSYSALGPTWAANTKLMCIFQLDNKFRVSILVWVEPHCHPETKSGLLLNP